MKEAWYPVILIWQNATKPMKNLVIPGIVIWITVWSYETRQWNNRAISPFAGSWKMKEIHWITKDTIYRIERAQPGMFIFTSGAYSVMWTPVNEPRPAFSNLSRPTDEEIKNGFQTIVFNAGSYEWRDSTIITNAYIAKVPGFEGGRQYYHFKLKEDVLSLTMYDETYPDGSRPEWYGRYVTRFLLTRLDPELKIK